MWDTIKAGAGGVVIALGGVVKAFGFVVRAFEEIIGLSKHLPDAVRPAWVDRMNDGITKFRGGVGRVGDDLINTGKGWITGWGKSAEQFNSWLDRITNKAKTVGPEMGKGITDAIADVWNPAKLAPAIESGSKEAYSLAVRNQVGDFGKPDADRVHIENGKKLDKIENRLNEISKKVDDFAEVGMV